jgi:indolepyruvate ferredoxin oxidoreductase
MIEAPTPANSAEVSLDDKYRLDRPHALISGRQALVRLPIAQRELDRAKGLKTAGLISGYRGSPLGSYDMDLWKASALLKQHDIIFQPGLNEDLALTALAGAQQLDFVPGRKVDGVFGIWYGKGPGVDRSGDAIKHANLHGVSPHGGIVLAFGDDHTGKSSTTAHQSDLTLASWGVPVLYPSSVSEILELGLAAFALSRFSGLIVGLKLVNETADGTGILDDTRLSGFEMPEIPGPDGGVHIRREMIAMQQQDLRLHRHKLPRAQGFARANRLDRMSFGSESARFVIATAGKAFPDVLAALSILGVTDEVARKVGIGVYKIGLIFPLDPVGLKAATVQAEEILFVEEKRAHLEMQAMGILYNHEPRARISGKSNPDGTFLLPADLPLDPQLVATAIAQRLLATFATLADRFPEFVQRAQRALSPPQTGMMSAPLASRRPAFCPGCPHNTSTVVPDGSFAGTGIGCHTMVLFHPDRNSLPVGHMGAEGAHWIGLSPFTETKHIFQNLGDGTYSHSGTLAIRAAVLANVNVTYKILLNDAVAMTGGQPVEGHLTAGRIVQQVRAEGVGRVVVVTDQPERYADSNSLPPGTEVRHRDELMQLQEALRREPGVTVIVYEQTCAAEKRRRRKINAYPDPPRRIFINSLVCEGCGDCSVQSNCLAIQPIETELGRKREIDQSACNKDFSCVKGFCPSFVTVKRGKIRRDALGSLPLASPPTPSVPVIGDGFDLIIAGIGGTGVVTVSAILGMAACIEGLGVNLYDMTGLSQKGGQVFSHVRLRNSQNACVPARVGLGEAHTILACDLIAAVQPEVLQAIARGKTRIFGNLDTIATADFQSHPDLTISANALAARLEAATGTSPKLIRAASLSQKLLGDSIAANMVLLGFAWQSGAIPLRLASIEKAIALNGKAADANLKAFSAGRNGITPTTARESRYNTPDEYVSNRCAELRAYWNEAYARRYKDLMRVVSAAAAPIVGGEIFVWAVARSAYKLMAYKDEYEVGRLYTDGRFRAALSHQFSDVPSIQIHLAPPLFSFIDRKTGRPRKFAFGGWIVPLLHVLRALKGLRETSFDIFGRSIERRLERELRDSYETVIGRVAATLAANNLQAAIDIAEAPLAVRGFGPVKWPSASALIERLRAIQAPMVSNNEGALRDGL